MSNVNKYFKINPDEIVKDILKDSKITNINLSNIKLSIFPNVYPSQRFRTTQFILDSLPDCSNKRVCDMGCGIGIIGLHALMNRKAKRVTFIDLNEFAIKNVQENLINNSISKNKYKICLSNAFTNVEKEIFDLIIFNIPFHNDSVNITLPIQRAFYDPLFKGVETFLMQAKDYMHSTSQILIAFSNKGDIKSLEKLLDSNNYKWELWKTTNQDQQFDNRLYLLRT